MPRSHRHPALALEARYLKGVGTRQAELLEKLGVRTVGDLLFHLPRAFDDLSNVRGLDELMPGEMQTVTGEVVELDSRQLDDGRRVFTAVVADAKGRCVEGIWFNQVAVARQFRFGQRVAFSGKPRWYRDHWAMNHPRVEILEASDGPQRSVIPVYPMTENLAPEKLREHLREALVAGAEHVEETIPEPLRKKYGFGTVAESLWSAHFPEVLAQGIQGKRRFVYEEFLILQTALAVRRREGRTLGQAPRMPVDAAIDAHIRKRFPFALTGDQNRAVRTICKDLASEQPMQRLLQADVGAGKTAVALYAMLVAVANRRQAVMMAPTEVLAQQHWRTLDRFLEGSRVRRALLTGGLSAGRRREVLAGLAAGELDCVVGTQALVQDDVRYANLGLAVIDEQHKFGVHQRARLRKLHPNVHYLVMTATPIPRTIALTVFGDLDVSSLRELPPGRQSVTTRWHSEKARDQVYEQTRARLREGRQAFVVCPLVEESETVDAKAAEATCAELKDGPFREFRVGVLHGRMSDDDKAATMEAFVRGEIQVLVATLVIEVGIDVANATVMIVEHADRFGLAQLHQLRGRVSRGATAGECHLFSGAATDDAKERLKIFTRTTDGFELAEEDARQRGVGEFFGTRQHGLGDLEFGDLLRDREVVELARSDATDLLASDPGLKREEHAALRRAVLERYGATLDLAEIG